MLEEEMGDADPQASDLWQTIHQFGGDQMESTGPRFQHDGFL
jgi:hypothetical protein